MMLLKVTLCCMKYDKKKNRMNKAIDVLEPDNTTLIPKRHKDKMYVIPEILFE